jgi:hypothetical protein
VNTVRTTIAVTTAQREQRNEEPPALQRKADRRSHRHAGAGGDREQEARPLGLAGGTAALAQDGSVHVEVRARDLLVADRLAQLFHQGFLGPLARLLSHVDSYGRATPHGCWSERRRSVRLLGDPGEVPDQ